MGDVFSIFLNKLSVFVHLSTQIQTHSSCFEKTLAWIWQISQIIIFHVNSWKFCPSPTIFYTIVTWNFCDKFRVCWLHTKLLQDLRMRQLITFFCEVTVEIWVIEFFKFWVSGFRIIVDNKFCQQGKWPNIKTSLTQLVSLWRVQWSSFRESLKHIHRGSHWR